MAVTHERILAAAVEAFAARWYDDVTLRGVAADAGVAVQTLVNHFGSKEGLYVEVGERIGQLASQARWTVKAGDVEGALDALLADYERLGDHMIRTLAVEEKVPVVRSQLAVGREGHERWVQHAFCAALEGLRGGALRRRIAQLVAVTDVYAWKVMRRDKGLSARQTKHAMRELVLALHPTTEEV